MTVNKLIRLVAGTLVLVSLLLSQVHTPLWLLLTAFIGLNLLQSAFSDTCPMMSLLRKIGVPEN